MDKLGLNIEEIKEIGWLFIGNYWPLIMLTVIITVSLKKHGIHGFLYYVLQQLLCVTLICIVSICGYVIITKKIKQFESKITLSIITDGMTGNYIKLLNDGDIMIPLSQLLFSIGIITFILGLLYTKLPIDLIPDIIPIIGSYDNYLT